ncbi:inositol 1,4,5-trisphosphate receptor-interacting protein-like 2 [Chanos chanos]|uniref:Inositol 1,4,5-trisphosphate receptor-interacting protein-like 2 n=1 Tax=Chanos chanos TaxID=29144 RepID=A0A6J2WS78_CHACN|nr:inositol 1,4,5-trisphosphate receptor-interacting protein-like 2 [Chanos chanos]
MTVYTLNLRVFWPLVICVCTALLLLHHLALRGVDDRGDGCSEQAPEAIALFKYFMVFLLCCIFFRFCSIKPGPTKRDFHKAPEGPGKILIPKKDLLEDHYERFVRLSPHVLGHSKAHVAKLVSELVRAGRTDGPPESSLAFRGDFIQIGSSYEEHKVGAPDCFDILVPLRLPRGLTLDPRVWTDGRKGPPLCTLETPRKSEWTRRHKAFADAFLRLNTEVHRLSPDCVLRWFYTAAQRCLSSVRYHFEQRCTLDLALSDEQRVLLRLTPRSDYVCCHFSMGVRLIPALPLADGAFLVAAGPGPLCGKDLWTVYFPKQEQRLLGWLKGRLPSGTCHLKCLQLLKEIRDLGGQTLDQQARAEWKGVLSSYTLKTTWLRLLLSTTSEAWEERHLVDRLEDLLRCLRESLQNRTLLHLLLGGDGRLLPESISLPKLVKETAPSNLWAGYSPVALDLVAARLAYTWTHLPRLVRLARPQKSSLARGLRCQHAELE